MAALQPHAERDFCAARLPGEPRLTFVASHGEQGRHAGCSVIIVLNLDTKGDHIMPYLLGWLLGVPVIVLVILYLIFH